MSEEPAGAAPSREPSPPRGSDPAAVVAVPAVVRLAPSTGSTRPTPNGEEPIFTYVRADNEAGLRCYARQGFRVVGTAERHCRIDGRYVDEVLVERFL